MVIYGIQTGHTEQHRQEEQELTVHTEPKRQLSRRGERPGLNSPVHSQGCSLTGNLWYSLAT